jgi:thioredoxin type arsenate reductase
MKNILFLCTGNSCRSQMAEGFARALARPGVQVQSAGTKPCGVNPRAVAVMAEVGIDLRSQSSKHVSVLSLDEIDTVVTLCGEALEACPVFPRKVYRIHWPIPDPARATGREAAVLDVFRRTRDEIHTRVRDLMRLASTEVPYPLALKERVFDRGKVVRVDRELVRLPGGRTADLEILHHPGAAALVPLLPDGTVVLIRQYRHATGGFIIEVPAGKLGPGEAPEGCARRECEEEAGYRVGRLHRLGFIYTTPGFTDEIIHLFAATDLEPVPLAHEHDEVIEVFTAPLHRALELVASNEIVDSKTVCALMRTDQELRAGTISCAGFPRPAPVRGAPKQ